MNAYRLCCCPGSSTRCVGHITRTETSPIRNNIGLYNIHCLYNMYRTIYHRPKSYNNTCMLYFYMHSIFCHPLHMHIFVIIHNVRSIFGLSLCVLKIII
jgi:hypothetical protein